MKPETPPLTVDIIIEMTDHSDTPIVLIKRRNPPPGWALPGGFVDYGETVAAAARREALEETGLAVTLTDLLGVYSDPARDPRGQTVSIVFVGAASGEPQAADDAIAVRVVDASAPPELAFDHSRIIADYLHLRRTGRRRLAD